MQETKNISIFSYDYDLPDERIAKFPLPKRDTSKLLLYKNGEIKESVFTELSGFIPESSLMVFNNTKVIQARIIFQKETGAKIEIFCLEPILPADYASAFQQTESVVWLCMVGNLKKWKDKFLSKKIFIDNKEYLLTAELIENNGLTHYIKFSWSCAYTDVACRVSANFAEILENIGELPIPPYLHRPACEKDNETYQTVYSKIKGSVAAPTAGLHFTPEVLEKLGKKNVQIEELTLHIGAGTFHPVKSEQIEGHEMHTEIFIVKKNFIEKLLNNLGKIIAVGTTSVRTLESLYYVGVQIEQNDGIEMKDIRVSQWQPYEKEQTIISTKKALENIINHLERNNRENLEIGTQIMIAPGFKYRIVSGIITNFHQPKSTLLLLVSAFVGEKWKDIYDYALAHEFRFLSYGDSSLLISPLGGWG
jgi:S-adenosylmethionine:tRNA ribosyltransferase-isomerase